MLLLLIGKKNNQSSVFYADRKIPTLKSAYNSGNSVNLGYGVMHLFSSLDFSVCIGNRRYLLFDASEKFQPSGQRIIPEIW